jgi:hypothetical protein
MWKKNKINSAEDLNSTPHMYYKKKTLPKVQKNEILLETHRILFLLAVLYLLRNHKARVNILHSK